jgi:DNA polymerase elongation subunit (family B)
MGIVPSILNIWFSERVEFKALAEKYKNEGDKVKELFYDRRQKRQKIFMNSVYGTLGLPIFRFYDKDNAEATTVSGQHVIKMTERFVNMKYADKFADKGEITNDDFVIYIDTDSVTGDCNLRFPNGTQDTISNTFKSIPTTKEIIDITGRHFKFPTNLFLPFYDEINKLVKWGKVQYVEKHVTSKRMYRIKTRSGKTLKVTEDHSLMVLENGQLLKKTPLELKKHDKIISI